MKLFTIIYIFIFAYMVLLIHYLGMYDDSFKELTTLEYVRISAFVLIVDIIIYGIYKLVKAIQQYQYKSMSRCLIAGIGCLRLSVMAACGGT